MSGNLDDRREIEVTGGRIRVRDIGDGPPLLFVHGAFVNGELWRDVVPPLSAHARCIVPDLPLGAHTTALDHDARNSPVTVARMLLELLDALGLEQATLVGNDTGGALSQIALALAPHRLTSLVLTNSDAYEYFFAPVLRPLAWGAFLPGYTTALAGALRPRWAQRVFAATVVHRRLDDELLDLAFSPLIERPEIRRDLGKFLRAVDRRHTLRAAEHFATFDRPVLVAWGEDDLFFPMRLAERLVDAFPNARLEPIPGSRTFVPLDRPALLIDAIRRHLDELRAGSGDERARQDSNSQPSG